jgi:uncharacterized membrane protein
MEEQTNQQNPNPEAPKSDPQDAEKNKAMGIIAYIIFFVPLLAARNSKFAMYHANQGLVLFLAWVALNIIGWIPIIGWILLPLGWIFLIVLAIMGIINASKGEMKPLPVIGSMQIIK